MPGRIRDQNGGWEHEDSRRRSDKGDVYKRQASVNGKPMSVRESFYDFMIENTLTEEPQQEAEVLGNVLGEYEPGIGDGWLAHRIEAGIRKGTVRIAKDDRNPFERWICKK